MIKLYQFPTFWGLPNVSPFCMKLETYLRMAKIPFEIVKVSNPRKAPKGKLPYIEDQGKKIADTGFIIEYLKKTYGDPLDAHLTPKQKAEGLALRRLMEEHLYWAMYYSRWLDPKIWPVFKKIVFGRLPFIKRELLARIVQKDRRNQIYGHGMGRHSPEEIYQLGIQDLRALATILNERQFLLGDTATSIDASGYAFIANIIVPPIESPIKLYGDSQPGLKNYCDRMKQLFYS